MSNYPYKRIEQNWQQYWETKSIYTTTNDTSKPKYYILDMFPYPSGAGLHVGHPLGYIATDIIARFKKMKGYNVLHPMGFDSFGLPTERYSMTTGVHPAEATRINIERFKEQLKTIGLGYDWDREIVTSKPDYYKWTQWIFLMLYNSWYCQDTQKARPIEELPIPEELLFEKDINAYIDSRRLAFIANIPVNWCEELSTVLANEEVEEWRSKGYSVIRKPVRQWMLRITEYADRLLEDLTLVQWPNSTKEMQINWIGKSEGAEIQFPVLGEEDNITVFTTRPDTIFGATYLVIAPELPLVDIIASPEQVEAIEEYRTNTKLKNDVERTELQKTKTGVFTGAYALNPLTKKEIPIWIADYVLPDYGTGAIMAVPAHDERDFEFATKFSLPIIHVVQSIDPLKEANVDQAFTEYGIAVNCDHQYIQLNGLPTQIVKEQIIEFLESAKIGRSKITYKLHDWLFSRQRFWGEPIPIIFYEDGTKRSLSLEELPLLLPEIESLESLRGESPLSKVEEWINFTDKNGRKGAFETNIMPQWAGSCWYYARFIDPKNDTAFCDPELEKYWLGENGVDLYVGGSEHAVLHLLYARFWHKVLYDYGYVTSKEPFAKLFHQGILLGTDGKRKMSKSLGNVVNPDDVIEQYGADSFRLFEMFLGPLEVSKPWSDSGIEGSFRFLNRVWRLFVDPETEHISGNVIVREMTLKELFLLHSTIKKVSVDIEALSFNTAISQMMIFINEITLLETKPKQMLIEFLKILSPFAPHISEELWKIYGNTTSIFLEKFPTYDETKLIVDEVEIIVQVNSKIKAKMIVSTKATASEQEKLALNIEEISLLLEGITPKKVISVPQKLVNFIL